MQVITVLLFFSMASTDSLDALKTLPNWASLMTLALVVFEASHPMENAVVLHVNTAVVPSGTGDGLSRATSNEKPSAVRDYK